MTGGEHRTDASEASTWDLIVVGAGMAGMTAAVVAQQNGLRVLVLEARSRVGGRMRSARTERGVVDLGATWFWANEPLIASFCQQLDAATFSQHVSGDAIFESTGQPPQRLSGNPIDTPAMRFAGGAQQLTQRLAALLPPEAIRLEHPVTEASVTATGVRVRAASAVFDARSLIIATPPALAITQIRFTPELPEELRDVAGRTAVWMGDMVKAVAVFERAFWRDDALAGSAVSYAGPFREIHDHSGPDGTPAALFGFAPASLLAGRSEGDIAGAFSGQLARLFGADAPSPLEVRILDWSREEYTAPRLRRSDASSENFGHPVFQNPVHDRIRWASTETATAFAGHVEGAIRAGLAAVESIVR